VDGFRRLLPGFHCVRARPKRHRAPSRPCPARLDSQRPANLPCERPDQREHLGSRYIPGRLQILSEHQPRSGCGYPSHEHPAVSSHPRRADHSSASERVAFGCDRGPLPVLQLEAEPSPGFREDAFSEVDCGRGFGERAEAGIETGRICFREHAGRSTRAAGAGAGRSSGGSRRGPGRLRDRAGVGAAVGAIASDIRVEGAPVPGMAGECRGHGDPLGDAAGRDWAVRDYGGYLQAVLKRSRRRSTTRWRLWTTSTSAPAWGRSARSGPRCPPPPRALSAKAQIRYLRAVQACESMRDRALALVPFYAGTRIAETVALDVDDVGLSARKGVLRVLGKGQREREVPIHPQLRATLADWLDERRAWPDASEPGAVSQPPRRPAERQGSARGDRGDRSAGGPR
jgi:hypothetical protein